MAVRLLNAAERVRVKFFPGLWWSPCVLFSSKPTTPKKAPRRTHIKKAKPQHAVDINKLLQELFSPTRTKRGPAGVSKPPLPTQAFLKTHLMSPKVPSLSPSPQTTQPLPTPSPPQHAAPGPIKPAPTPGAVPPGSTPVGLSTTSASPPAALPLATAAAFEPPPITPSMSPSSTAADTSILTTQPALETSGTVETTVEPIPVEPVVESRTETPGGPVDTLPTSQEPLADPIEFTAHISTASTQEPPSTAWLESPTDGRQAQTSGPALTEPVTTPSLVTSRNPEDIRSSSASVENETCDITFTGEAGAALEPSPIDVGTVVLSPAILNENEIKSSFSAMEPKAEIIVSSVESSADLPPEVEVLDSSIVSVENKVSPPLETTAESAVLSEAMKVEEAPLYQPQAEMDPLQADGLAHTAPSVEIKEKEPLIHTGGSTEALSEAGLHLFPGVLQTDNIGQNILSMDTEVQEVESRDVCQSTGAAEQVIAGELRGNGTVLEVGKEDQTGGDEIPDVEAGGQERTSMEAMTLESMTLAEVETVIGALDSEVLNETKMTLDTEAEIFAREERLVEESVGVFSEDSQTGAETGSLESLSEATEALEVETAVLLEALYFSDHVPAVPAQPPEVHPSVEHILDPQVSGEQPTEPGFSVEPAEHQLSVEPAEHQLSVEPAELQFSVEPAEHQLPVEMTIEILSTSSVHDTVSVHHSNGDVLVGQEAAGEVVVNGEADISPLEAMTLESITLATVEASVGSLERDTLSKTTEQLEREAEEFAREARLGEDRTGEECGSMSEEETAGFDAAPLDSLPEVLMAETETLMEELIFSVPGPVAVPSEDVIGTEVARQTVTGEEVRGGEGLAADEEMTLESVLLAEAETGLDWMGAGTPEGPEATAEEAGGTMTQEAGGTMHQEAGGTMPQEAEGIESESFLAADTSGLSTDNLLEAAEVLETEVAVVLESLVCSGPQPLSPVADFVLEALDASAPQEAVEPPAQEEVLPVDGDGKEEEPPMEVHETHKDMDPVQRLFLEKIREYGVHSRLSDLEKNQSEEIARLQRSFGGGDLEKFPEFTFPEPKLDQE